MYRDWGACGETLERKRLTAANYFWYATRSFTFGSMSTCRPCCIVRECFFYFRPYELYFFNYGPTVDIAVQTKAKVTAQ